MKEQKFKDDKGHTIYLDSEADGIRCKCPYCNEVKIFDKCSQLNKTEEEEQDKQN